jgi:succinylglutamate desuccinylase
VANLISAFNELSNYFKKYEHIPQIQELYKEKDMIIVELNSQIIEDFEAFEKGSSLLKS